MEKFKGKFLLPLTVTIVGGVVLSIFGFSGQPNQTATINNSPSAIATINQIGDIIVNQKSSERHLTDDFKKQLDTVLANYGGQLVNIGYMASDQEAINFFSEISDYLSSRGFIANPDVLQSVVLASGIRYRYAKPLDQLENLSEEGMKRFKDELGLDSDKPLFDSRGILYFEIGPAE